jgi:heat-inducible transcriptional repressor
MKKRNHIDAKSSPALNERAQLLLKVLVERYIRDGQPVGSKALSQDLGQVLSPATIRHVLAELEEQGLLISPHTSAGRIPTSAGYRLFVNHLLTIQDLSETQVKKLKHRLSPELQMSELLQFSSSMLSDITQFVGITTLPAVETLRLEHIEFVPLSGQRILVILVLNDRDVQNRILTLDRTYTQAELQSYANFLNQRYCGMDLCAVQQQLKQTISNEIEEMDALLQTAMNLARRALMPEQADEGFVLAGQDNMVRLSSQHKNVEALYELFGALKQKQDILDLLSQCVQSDGVQIFIGEESGCHQLCDYSIVGAPYAMDGKILGVLGVIGPTRMRYDQVISVVDVTAKLLTAALNLAD